MKKIWCLPVALFLMEVVVPPLLPRPMVGGIPKEGQCSVG